MLNNVFTIVKHCAKYILYLYRKQHFGQIYISCNIKRPILITSKYIFLGKNVRIGHNARIQGVDTYNNNRYTPKIVIDDNVSIEQNIHLTCANSIFIGKNTAIAANVTITDINHCYLDVNTPIEKQDLEVAFVKIGEDCKICNGAVVLPAVSIGRHVCIGANTVVNRDIPDYCVAVGSPARIIKRYNFETKQWQKTDKDGNFL